MDIKQVKITSQSLEGHHMAVSLISGHEIMTISKVPMEVLQNIPEGIYYLFFSLQCNRKT